MKFDCNLSKHSYLRIQHTKRSLLEKVQRRFTPESLTLENTVFR